MRRNNTGAKPAKIVTFIMALVFGLVSVLMLVVVPSVIEKGSAECTESVIAEITDIVKSTDGDTYAPVYSYNYNGNTYSVQSNLYTNVIPKEGSEIEIMVDPNDPNHMADPARLQFVSHILNIIGIVFGVITGAFLITFIVLCAVLK